MPLVFSEEVMSHTLPGYRFVPRDDVFMSPESYPENGCFCVDRTLCEMVGDGMFGVSTCQFNAPIVLSWPHFLKADPAFLEKVEGLRPDKDRHGFWFDIQPVTGTTLVAKARLQVNIAIKKIDSYTALKNLKEDTIIPITWFEEGLDELGTELVDAISVAVKQPPIYKNYVLCTLIGLAVSAFVVGAVSAVSLCFDRRKRARDERIANVAKNFIIRPAQMGLGGRNGDLSQQVPMLLPSGTDSGLTTTESSRITSASHSRNASDGSNIPIVNAAAPVDKMLVNERPSGSGVV